MVERLIVGVRPQVPAGPRGEARPTQLYVFLQRKGKSLVQWDEQEVSRWLAGFIRKDATFLLSGAKGADRLAFDIAARAFDAGARVLRIPSATFTDYLRVSPDDISKVLVTTYRFRPALFVPVTREEVGAWRAKHRLDQMSLDI